jgi:hypothetical protein
MLFCFFGAYAQEDSGFAVPKARPMYGNYHDMEQGMNHLKMIDTGMHQIQKFDPSYLQNLGTPGTPAFPLIWDPFKAPGFDLGFHQWDIYRMTDDSARMYNTQNPYADLFYVQGSPDIQSFKVKYSQNIKPYWNFSISFNALNTSKSNYDPQATSVNTTVVNTWYKSPNGRYMAIVNGVVNNFSAQENGGLRNDSLFIKSAPDSRTGLPVNLGATLYPLSAKQAFNENFISARQYLRFGPVRQIKVHDTDSVATKILHPEFFVSHAIEYHFTKYTYNDQNAGPNQPFSYAIDPSQTNGTYQAEEFTNKIAIGHAEFNNAIRVKKKIDSSALRRQPLFYQAFAKYTYITAYQVSGQLSDHRVFDNTSIGFEIVKNGKFGLNAYGEYFLAGYNQNDYLVRVHVHLPMLKTILQRLNFDVKAQQAEPSYTDQLFIGNHFGWLNQFNKSIFSEARVYFSDSTGLKLGGAYQSATNLVYYDSAMPHQDPATVAFVQIFASKDIQVNHLHFLNTITYQKALSHGYDVRVPEWLFRSSWYYEHYLFQKALLFQGGIDFSYSTAYYGYGYMPEISRFYVQDKVKLGNYPVFDVWISGKVKRFNFFGKLEHINQGLSGYNYFLVPHYPLYPLSYRFGIKWMFFN